MPMTGKWIQISLEKVVVHFKAHQLITEMEAAEEWKIPLSLVNKMLTQREVEASMEGSAGGNPGYSTLAFSSSW